MRAVNVEEGFRQYGVIVALFIALVLVNLERARAERPGLIDMHLTGILIPDWVRAAAEGEFRVVNVHLRIPAFKPDSNLTIRILEGRVIHLDVGRLPDMILVCRIHMDPYVEVANREIAKVHDLCAVRVSAH